MPSSKQADDSTLPWMPPLTLQMSDLAVELGYDGAPGLPPAHQDGGEANSGDSSGNERADGGKTKKGWRGLFGGRRKQAADP